MIFYYDIEFINYCFVTTRIFMYIGYTELLELTRVIT